MSDAPLPVWLGLVVLVVLALVFAYVWWRETK
jgi:hypothetical protein